MKHTETGVKMTGIPVSFGFTLLVRQATKQGKVLLYICEEQHFFSWVHHLASAPCFPNYYLQKVFFKKHYIILNILIKKKNGAC